MIDTGNIGSGFRSLKKVKKSGERSYNKKSISPEKQVNKKARNAKRRKYDFTWKEVIERLFEDFLEFFPQEVEEKSRRKRVEKSLDMDYNGT